jgi:phosphatidylglycerol:prolipoprotein diacylglycerol transferase
MHPILWRIPLPAWALPLSPALLLIGVLGAGLVVLAWRARASELGWLGATVALTGTLCSLWLQGQTISLSALIVPSYGAMLGIALVVGWYLTSALGRRDGLPKELLVGAFFIATVAGIFGARLLYVAINTGPWDGVSACLVETLSLGRGGLIGYGALVVGFSAAAVYLRVRGFRVRAWADAAAPSIALGIALTRIGSYLLGSDFGKPLAESAPKWLVVLGTFPRWPADVFNGAGAPAWVHQVNRGLIELGRERSLPVHPTELYEALAGLVLFAVVVWLGRRRQLGGEPFCALVFGYGVVRWVLDAWRDDPERGLVGPRLSEHHYLPLGLAALAMAWVAGPARLVPRSTIRHAVELVAFVPALLAFWLTLPATHGSSSAVQVTLSQWLGLSTALLALGTHQWLLREARALSAESADTDATASSWTKRFTRPP